jgi:hypothetical protein
MIIYWHEKQIIKNSAIKDKKWENRKISKFIRRKVRELTRKNRK